MRVLGIGVALVCSLLFVAAAEADVFEDPKSLGFRKVSEHAVAVVE